MAKHKVAKRVKAVKMPKMPMHAMMGAAKPAKGKVYLRDSADRFFTLEREGVQLELKAGVLCEVDKKVGEFLKKKYPYLELVK